MNHGIKRYLIYIPLFIAVYFSVFHFIDQSPIFIYDEGSYSNNAIEMTKNNNFLVLHYDGEPTLYNTKPPFVIWMQSFFMRLLGMNELAVRLPSALSAFIVVIGLLLFAERILKKPLIGIIATIALMGTLGYIKPHVVRSGDLDAMLVMWASLYSLIYFSLLLQKDKNITKYILATCLGVVFAFLSKSVAGLIPIMGLFIATLFSDKKKAIFQNRYLYIGGFLTIICCIGYYLLREYNAEGYLDKVLFSEYTRIYDNVMPWHTQPALFYWDIFTSLNHFTPFIYFLPAAILLGLFSNERLIQKTTLYLSIWCFSFFLVISYPPNKIEWYDAPLYPFLCLLIGIFVYELFKNINKVLANQYLKIGLQISLCAALFIYPYYRVVQRNFTEHQTIHELEREGLFVRTLTKNRSDIKAYTILMQTNHPHHLDAAKFYMKAANYEHGKNISLKKHLSEITPNETILVCQQNKQDSIKNLYHFAVVDKFKECQLIELKGYN